MDWEEHKKILLKDPELRRILAKTELEFQISRAIIGARIEKRLTQKQLAEKLGTKQSVISRLESGTTTPSLSLLKRVAEALDISLEIRFRVQQ